MPEEPHLTVHAERVLDEQYRCAGCDREFVQEEWALVENAGDPQHGHALYGCPTDDCDGTARVLY